MKLICFLRRTLLFLVLASVEASGQVTGAPTLSAVQEHSFKLVLKYFYTVEDYTPPLGIEKVSKDGQGYTTAERALALLILAARSGGYSSWFSMWDAPSQQRIETERSEAAISESEFIRKKVDEYRGVSIMSFITRGPYVILRFGRDHQDSSAIAFKQTRVGWVPTREIDAEVEALASGKYEATNRVVQ